MRRSAEPWLAALAALCLAAVAATAQPVCVYSPDAAEADVLAKVLTAAGTAAAPVTDWNAVPWDAMDCLVIAAVPDGTGFRIMPAVQAFVARGGRLVILGPANLGYPPPVPWPFDGVGTGLATSDVLPRGAESDATLAGTDGVRLPVPPLTPGFAVRTYLCGGPAGTSFLADRRGCLGLYGRYGRGLVFRLGLAIGRTGTAFNDASYGVAVGEAEYLEALLRVWPDAATPGDSPAAVARTELETAHAAAVDGIAGLPAACRDRLTAAEAAVYERIRGEFDRVAAGAEFAANRRLFELCQEYDRAWLAEWRHQARGFADDDIRQARQIPDYVLGFFFSFRVVWLFPEDERDLAVAWLARRLRRETGANLLVEEFQRHDGARQPNLTPAIQDAVLGNRAFGLATALMSTAPDLPRFADTLTVFGRNVGALAVLVDEPAWRFGKFLYNADDPDREAAAERFLALPAVRARVAAAKLEVAADTLFDRALARRDPRTWMLAGEFAQSRQQTIRDRLLGSLRDQGLGVHGWINSISKFNDWSRSVSVPTLLPGCDLASMDVYLLGSVIEAAYLEMIRAVSTGRVLHCNGWKYRTPVEWRNSCLLSLLHADGIVVFDLLGQFEPMTGYATARRNWAPGIWAETRRLFRQAQTAAPLLAGTVPVSDVAILLSERTQWARYDGDWASEYGESPSLRYIGNVAGLFGLLTQLHLMPKMIYAEHRLREKLAETAVLFLPLGEGLTDAELDAVGDWVAQGGVLFAFGRTSRFSPDGEPLRNYRLADLFGCDFRSEHGNRLLLRQLKTPAPFPRVRCGERVFPYTSEHYQGVLRYDQVTPRADATVAAVWENTGVGADGAPALLRRREGRGAVLFCTGADAPLCFRKAGLVTRDTTGPVPDARGNYELWQAFDPEFKGMVAAELEAAMAAVGRQPAWRFDGLPDDVDVTVRRAPGGSPCVVQFHRYRDHDRPVTGASLHVDTSRTGVFSRARVPGRRPSERPGDLSARRHGEPPSRGLGRPGPPSLQDDVRALSLERPRPAGQHDPAPSRSTDSDGGLMVLAAPGAGSGQTVAIPEFEEYGILVLEP